MSRHRFGVREVRISGFRSAREVVFSPGPVCALVGGPSVGKSNVLAAIWTLLQGGAPAPSAADIPAPDGLGAEEIGISARLAGGREIRLSGRPPGGIVAGGDPQPVLFLPASLRSGALVAEPVLAPRAAELARRHLGVPVRASSSAGAERLLNGMEELCSAGERGLVLLIEEPELFLRPQAQRYLYRLLRRFADAGNQVLYSTHEPVFLNVGRLEELALVEHASRGGTRVTQPRPLGADESFRALSELDAERGELLLARAVLLVEGRTEKLTLPFVFQALGYDADREAVTIVDCGGKPNIPLFIRICQAARIPCVAMHDRDAAPERRPSQAQRVVNAEIASLAGDERTVVLAPDFEAVAGLRGHRHKPARAWQRFSRIDPELVPPPLARAVRMVVELARG